MNNIYRSILTWVLISLFMVVIFNALSEKQPPQKTVLSFSAFLKEVSAGKVKNVVIQGEKIEGEYKDKKKFITYTPFYPKLVDFLNKNNVIITVKPKDQNAWYISLLNSWLPMIFLIAVWIFFMRQIQIGGGKAMSFGKARARLLTEQENKVTFEDVAGIDEAKEEVKEIIEFLKNPKKFTKLGGKIPKGVLLVGPPGTGKTLLAKAIAGEADVPFFSISGSDFVEMFVGVGASRVRDLFVQGKRNAPCIIFIDEIDAVGRYRGAGLGGGHDEREQTLNQLLVEMDGFDSKEGVILIAATNRPDVLDPALLRPGRFDRQIVVPIPDVRGREAILKVHAKNVPLDDDVSFSILAKTTPGFSGADLANLVNEAALIAARKNKEKVSMEDFEEAKDKVLMGVERKSMIISEKEKELTAYHEAGHALIAKSLPGTDPIHKVTIIPRGRALGVTQQLPVDERHTYSREYLINNITILLGGRAAEEIIFKDFTTGAGNDLEKVTEIARRMVCEWGMSKELGPLTFGRRDQQIFLGRDLLKEKDYSESTAVMIDKEVRRIVLDCYNRAKNIISDNIKALHAIAKTLLEKEVLTGDEIEKIIKDNKALPEDNEALPAVHT